MSNSTSSIATDLAPEYDYNEQLPKPASVSYMRVSPSNTNDLHFGSGQSSELTVDPPSTRCVIPARCFARYNVTIPWGVVRAATDTNQLCMVCNSKSVPFWHNLRAQLEKGKAAVYDSQGHLADISQMILPYSMTAEEFKKRDPAFQTMFPAMSSSNPLITGATTYSANSLAHINPQYVQSVFSASGSAIAATAPAMTIVGAKAYLKDLAPEGFFSMDKVLPPSSGQYSFTLGFPERHLMIASGTAADQVTSATSWSAGALSDYAGTISITNLEFYFAVENDANVENMLAQKVASTGFQLRIPSPMFRQLPLTARTNHQIHYSVEPAYGKTLRKVFTAAVPNNPPRTAFMYDNNNLGSGTNSISTSSAVSYGTTTTSTLLSPTATTLKVKSYVTSVEGKRTTEFDIDSEDKQDYILNGKTFNESIIQNNLQYLNNYVIIDDWTGGISRDYKTIHSGLLLGDKSKTYTVDVTTKASTAYNWNQVYVFEKQLLWSSAGIAFV